MEIVTDYSQTYLLPPSISDWIPEDHPSRFIREFVDAINLTEYGFKRRPSEEGRPNYSNNLLLKIWLYCYYEKIYSLREIEKACQNQLPLIWLTTNQQPDHNTIWRFFKENKKSIKVVFRSTVKLAVKLDMVGFVLQAIDGTKIRANVSKDKELYLPRLQKLLSMIDVSIEKTHREIENHNKDDKTRRRDDHLPIRMTDKRQMRALIEKGIEELKAEEKEDLKRSLESSLNEMEKANRKLLHPTDSESRFMLSSSGKGRGEFCYNAQSVVDESNQIILGAKVVNDEIDNHLLTDMMEEAKENSGRKTVETLADSGYYSGLEIEKAEKAGMGVLVNIPKKSRKEEGFRKEDFIYDMDKDIYICPMNKEMVLRKNHYDRRRKKAIRVYIASDCHKCPVRAKCCGKSARRIERYEYEESTNRHAQKHKEHKNRELLDRRPQIIEPIFAWIKHNNNFGQWNYRGLESVNAQWWLLCSALNLSKIYKVWVTNKGVTT